MNWRRFLPSLIVLAVVAVVWNFSNGLPAAPANQPDEIALASDRARLVTVRRDGAVIGTLELPAAATGPIAMTVTNIEITVTPK